MRLLNKGLEEANVRVAWLEQEYDIVCDLTESIPIMIRLERL